MKRLTVKEVIERAGLAEDQLYMHMKTAAVDTGAGWRKTLRNSDPKSDSIFEPVGDGAMLIHVKRDEDGNWVGCY